MSTTDRITDWLTLAIVVGLAVAGIVMRVRRKARERAARIDPCDAIAWHAAKRRGELR